MQVSDSIWTYILARELYNLILLKNSSSGPQDATIWYNYATVLWGRASKCFNWWHQCDLLVQSVQLVAFLFFTCCLASLLCNRGHLASLHANFLQKQSGSLLTGVLLLVTLQRLLLLACSQICICCSETYMTLIILLYIYTVCIHRCACSACASKSARRNNG